jgi:hypothetical protein
MQQALCRSSLVPAGFVVESAFYEADKAVITVRPSIGFGLCPSCGTVSRRVRSHYRRRVRDLPLSGRMVELVVIARRFRCDAVLCGQRIFTERFAEGVLAPWGAAYEQARRHHPSPRPCARGQAGGDLREAADAAGE